MFPNTPPAQGNPICVRLETALKQLDVPVGGDPDVLRRYDESINRQRVELDQAIMQGRRLGCDFRGGFFLFGSLQRPPQCDQLNARIVQMRNNVDRMMSEVERLRGSDTGRDAQRRQLVATLAQNNCGPQYRAAAAPQQPQRPRTLFESLFGGPLREEASPDADPLQLPLSGAFRTVCVRTCDGFFFPISYATTQAKFAEDEQACKRLCPATATELYYHRNPGEEIEQAVSTLRRALHVAADRVQVSPGGRSGLLVPRAGTDLERGAYRQARCDLAAGRHRGDRRAGTEDVAAEGADAAEGGQGPARPAARGARTAAGRGAHTAAAGTGARGDAERRAQGARGRAAVLSGSLKLKNPRLRSGSGLRR